MKVKILPGIFLVFYFASFSPHALEEDRSDWKDPMYRDEDISKTDISVEVNRTSEGFFEYIYKISSPPENTGVINHFNVDIECNLKFPDVGLPPSDHEIAKYPKLKHVPVSIKHTPGNSGSLGILPHNQAGWGMDVTPGETIYARMLSTTPPGKRDYGIHPKLPLDGWRYDLYQDNEEEYGKLPWIEDFIVTGTTIGPACTLGTAPVAEYQVATKESLGIDKSPDSAEPPNETILDPDDIQLSEEDLLYLEKDYANLISKLYRGQLLNEDEAVNDLLVYEHVKSENIMVPAQGKMRIVVKYHPKIDKEHLVVELNNKDISHLFNPRPGLFDVVLIEGLKPGRNFLKLRIPEKLPSGSAESPQWDYDSFEVNLEKGLELQFKSQRRKPK